MLGLKSRMKMLDSRKMADSSQSLQSTESAQSSPRCQLAVPLDQSAAASPPVAAEQPTSPKQQHSRYLVITVMEARNLVAKDYDTHSSDPFVKITMGTCSRKTRAIYRNCHPLWEQKLAFVIDGVPEGEPLLVELFDKDFNSKEFLGQVMMTLGKALEIEADEAQRGSYWLMLSKKRSSDVVGGELRLGFHVVSMDTQQYNQFQAEQEAGVNADLLAAAYSSKALHIRLKGLNGLAASGLLPGGGAKANEQLPQLSLFIKYGRITIQKQLPLPATSHMSEDEPGDSSCCDSYEVTVNEEALLPLAAAVRATPLVARKKDELCDIKLYLKSQDTLIAKTQIPIAAVPFISGPSSAAPQACDDSASVGGPGTTTPLLSARTTHDAGHKVLEVAEASHLAPSSVPGTPRGTMADYTPLAFNPSVNSSPLPELPASPITRTRSDALNLSHLNKRLGTLSGWGGSSGTLSNLSTAGPTLSAASTLMPAASTDSPAAVPSKACMIEGSLDSITACGRPHPVHAPAGLHGRRVQGLVQMHEGSVLKKPLKAIFVQPREISVSGWVPIKASDESEDSHSPSCHQGRLFCRIMESSIPMYCSLEVSLSLAVVDQKAAVPEAPGVDSSSGSADNLCYDLSEDEEEATQATPIQLPTPYEVVLQDATLQGIGVNRLFALVVSDQSAVMTAHQGAQGISEVTVGPWKAGVAGSGCQRVRDVSYTKRLNLPLPLAPDKCHVWEEHRLVVKEAGGWVVQLVCKNDAPKGDCFEAHVQICGVYVTSSSSRLHVSMQLNWIKNTWGKSMVQGGAETDAKRGYQALVKLLQQQAGSSSCASSVGADVQGPEGSAAGHEQLATAAATGRQVAWQLPSSLGPLLQVALVLALLLLAWAVLSAGKSISSELRAVAAAVRECSAAGLQ